MIKNKGLRNDLFNNLIGETKMPSYLFVCDCGYSDEPFMSVSQFERKKGEMKCLECGKLMRHKITAPYVDPQGVAFGQRKVAK